MDLHMAYTSVQNSGVAVRQQRQDEEFIDHLTYWKQQLQDAPLILDLPTDRPRPLSHSGVKAQYSFVLPEPLSARLKLLSQQEGVSLFVTLLAAFQTLLYRYTAQDDLLVGTAHTKRAQLEFNNGQDARQDIVNLLVMRTRISGNISFQELLGRVRKVVLEAYTHQDVLFEQVVEALQPERDTNRNPVCQVMFLLEEASPEALNEPALSLTPLEMEGERAKFDLALFVQDAAQELRGCIEYNADLFETTTIAQIASHWQRLSEGIVADPNQHLDDLPLLTDAEWQQQVVEWNATQTAYPYNQCFHELFEAQVERTPEAVAVVFEQEQLTYRELNSRANQLARYLQGLGVGPETLVSLLSERGTAFLIAVLAIFKAGGAYLPLDPHHPPARIHHILEHSGSRLVLAAKKFSATLTQATTDMPVEASPQVVYFEDFQFQHGTDEGNLPLRATPHNLAYVIYTSGSTGMPKGVMIEQRGMLNHLYAKIAALQLTTADSVAQTASQCFDISVWQFLAALLVGGSVHIFNDEVTHNPTLLLREVEQHQISILETVPSLLGVMLESIEKGSTTYPHLEKLRWLIPTGEALPPEFCRRWLAIYPHIPLLNAYGPTECSDDVTHFPIYQPLTDTLVHTPIGRPINNMRLYILDRQLRPLPVGVSGELHVGGIGVGRGYLNDAQRTAEAFVPDPFSNEPGMRLYKTGDLARYLPDGNIEFLGRIDYQVKIRGNRIELGEIEAVLHQYPNVQDVAVIAREDTPGDKYLAAYVVGYADVTTNDLRNYLKEKLPDYMIPAAFVLLEALPLTPNGKVDRRALPVPERRRQEETFVAPTHPVHQQLIQIWEELLDARPIGIQDNFFEIGGHSLLAVRLIDRIEQVWGKRISATTLLAGPTIEQLATVLVPPEDTGSAASAGAKTADNNRSFSPLRKLLKSLVGPNRRN